jgi:hypothetical protein
MSGESMRHPFGLLGLLAVAGAASLFGLAGCKKKPSVLRFIVNTAPGLRPDEFQITIGGKPVPVTEKDRSPYVDFKPGEVPPTTPATITYATPCGKKTLTVAPKNKPTEFGVVDIDIKPELLPERRRLVFDPAVASIVNLGELTIPQPLPQDLYVTFEKCPQKVKIADREIDLPPGPLHTPIFIGRDPKACYLSGEVRFGPANPACRPDSSTRLTGRDTYVLSSMPHYFFEGVPTTAKVYNGKCTNSTYLQRCP